MDVIDIGSRSNRRSAPTSALRGCGTLPRSQSCSSGPRVTGIPQAATVDWVLLTFRRGGGASFQWHFFFYHPRLIHNFFFYLFLCYNSITVLFFTLRQSWVEEVKAHRARGLSKPIDPARRYLGWEGDLRGDLSGGTPGLGVVGWARGRTPDVCPH